jgi:hypothetical protein
MDGSGVYDQRASVDGTVITPWGAAAGREAQDGTSSPPISPLRSPGEHAASSSSPIHPLDASGRQWRRERQRERLGDLSGTAAESFPSDEVVAVPFGGWSGHHDHEESTAAPIGGVLPAMFEANPRLSLDDLRAQEVSARRMVQKAVIALRVQQALRFQREADRFFMLPISAGFRDDARDWYKKALALDRSNAEVRAMLILMDQLDGLHGEVRKNAAERYVSGSQSPAACIKAGGGPLVFFAHEDVERAMRHVRGKVAETLMSVADGAALNDSIRAAKLLYSCIDELEAEVPGSGGPQATRKLACLDRGQPIEDGDPGMNGRISLAAAQTYVVKARQALEKVRRAREGVGRARKEEEERMRQPCAICFESLAAWSELETVSHTTQPHSHTATQPHSHTTHSVNQLTHSRFALLTLRWRSLHRIWTVSRWFSTAGTPSAGAA